MKTLLAALTLISTIFGYGEEAKDAGQAPSFFRFGENRLSIVTWADADKESTFYMNVEPGCILIRVKLIEMKQAHYTYEIIDSPGSLTIAKMAKKALGIESNVFELAFSERVSKIGDTERISYMIDGIKDKNNKANKSEMATPRKPSD